MGLLVGRWLSLVPSPRCWLHVACRSLSARLLCAPYWPSARVWSACKARLSQLSFGSRYMGLPHHQQGVPSVWLWMSRARVLSWAQPRPCWALVSLRYCMGGAPLGFCWWMCEGSNLMDQRVLAFVKVGLWLADCSPVESHPCCIVLLMLQCSSRCVVVLLRCCARVALSCLLLCCVRRRCSVECSLRCVAVPLSSVCPRRRVCCARRRCCSLASWPLLLRCCAHTPCHACCCVHCRLQC